VEPSHWFPRASFFSEELERNGETLRKGGRRAIGRQSLTKDQATALLRPGVIAWAFAGLVGIPAAVYFDFLGGWRWPPYNAVYDQMIVSVYVAVGICAAIAIREPLRHVSFLWFVALSSYTHGLVMLFHAVTNPTHIHHLLGDVWILAGGTSLAWPLWRARHLKPQD
jgi:hypothetical protein